MADGNLTQRKRLDGYDARVMYTLAANPNALPALPDAGRRGAISPIRRLGSTVLLAAATTAAACAAGVSAPQRTAATLHARAAAATGLQNPQGLAIAANGDLYVTNFQANTVTVYGTNLVQKTASTIATVYVAGVLNTYANNGSGAIDYYRCDGTFEYQFVEPGVKYPYVVAASKHFIAYAGTNLGQPSGTSANYTYTQPQLASTGQQSAPGYGWSAHAVSGLAFDSNEKLYVAQADTDSVGLFTPLQNTYVTFIKQLGFAPTGIAVDLAHNHVFVADGAQNTIDVYTAAGSFLTTLH